jgi:hypothetical protein
MPDLSTWTIHDFIDVYILALRGEPERARQTPSPGAYYGDITLLWRHDLSSV